MNLIKFLKLAEMLENDKEAFNSFCTQFDAFIKKHSHFIPDNDKKTPNPWRKNMDYSEEEQSPYYGNVSEFMKKFPGGLKEWIEWKRNNVDDMYVDDEDDEDYTVEYLPAEEMTAEERKEAIDTVLENVEMYKEMYDLSDDEIKKAIETRYGKTIKACINDEKEKHINNFLGSYQQEVKDGDIINDFIKYFKLFKKNRKAKK